MDSNELRLLAKHMGHDLNIHTDHYTLQLSILERTKVARVLSAVSTGQLGRFKEPKKIEEIQVDDVDLWQRKGKLYLSTIHFCKICCMLIK